MKQRKRTEQAQNYLDQFKFSCTDDKLIIETCDGTQELYLPDCNEIQIRDFITHKVSGPMARDLSENKHWLEPVIYATLLYMHDVEPQESNAPTPRRYVYWLNSELREGTRSARIVEVSVSGGSMALFPVVDSRTGGKGGHGYTCENGEVYTSETSNADFLKDNFNITLRQ